MRRTAQDATPRAVPVIDTGEETPHKDKAVGSKRFVVLARSQPRRGHQRLTSTLNQRHAQYYGAQQDRGRQARRNRAAELIEELRELWPGVVRDAEEQRQKADEFFSRKAEKAAKATHAFLSSDLLKATLPLVELPDQLSSWKWVAPSLYQDLKRLLDANAACRFLLAAIPLLTRERPKTVRAWLQKSV